MRKRTPLYLNSLEDAQKKGGEEVDKYLDMVIRDYTEFINIIKRNEKYYVGI